MKRVFFYSGLLLAGMAVAQTVNLAPFQPVIAFITMTCLSYIMIEVGLEFTLDKSRLGRYGTDFFVATTSAALPWLFCGAYLTWVVGTGWKEAALVSLFAAPTSAGVLFTMLSAAGLAGTWLYQKARVLAIFDDLATVLFLIPLQILFIGLKLEMLASLVLITLLYIAVYRWLHQLTWSTRKEALLGYALCITVFCWVLKAVAHIHLESLLPAFALGCMLKAHAVSGEGDDPRSGLDQGLKALFMFLVGACLPQVSFAEAQPGIVLMHVVALTILANLGKCFTWVCYRKEVDFKRRLALSVALFPRGEVGAGVLLIALGYGLTGLSQTLAGLCLALNLLLTSFFIWIVIRLLGIQRGTAVNS